MTPEEETASMDAVDKAMEAMLKCGIGILLFRKVDDDTVSFEVIPSDRVFIHEQERPQ